MRIQHQSAPLLLLLLPSVVSAAAVPDTGYSGAQSNLDTTSTKSKIDVGTKNAPVDGKDGMPHEGPFITTDKDRKKTTDASDLSDPKRPPTLKDSSSDSITIDGKKIPESNDGVMDDPNHEPPKQGTIGTEGGVSEKDKARKVKEGETGEKVENVPITPNEVPPELEEVTDGKDSSKDKSKDDSSRTTNDLVGGFEVSLLTNMKPEPLTAVKWKQNADVEINL